MLGVARDAEVLAERYERALDELPERTCGDPSGNGWSRAPRSAIERAAKRSLTAMRSPALFPAARRARSAGGRRACRRRHRARNPTQVTIDSAYKRVRKAAKAADAAADGPRRRHATRRCTGSASAPSDFATPRRPPARARWRTEAKTIQTLLGDHQDSVVSRSHLSRQAEAGARRRRGHLHLRAAVPAGGRPRPAVAKSRSTTRCKKLDKAVRKA